ncbi:hypothetical protein [Paraburkholderia sp. SIMBA_054]|uniref:hypothetical protein n=1 Tax=Paraburkholderia sp. SIMBA_054 TaxID=3085795 RepID=UPI00397DC7BA
MSRYIGKTQAVAVLSAADWWKERCFLADVSIFSDAPLWSKGNLDVFRQLFEQNAIEGSDRDFFDKLKEQLQGASPAIKQLAAEVLWFYMLYPQKRVYGPDKKADQIRTVWSWSGEEIPDARWIAADVLDGIGSPGVAYLTRRFEQLTFFLHAMIAWKSLTDEERADLMTNDRPWGFVAWVDNLPNAGKRPMRGALLYLVFPDELERVISPDHRRLMYAAFKPLIPTGQVPTSAKPSALEIDRALSVIRQQLEREYGTEELDFYYPPLQQRWSSVSAKTARRNVAGAIEKALEPYGLELRQCGVKKSNLAACKPVDEKTGFWADPADATNKPLRWIIQIDLTGDEPIARLAEHDGKQLLGNRRIGFSNNAQEKSGAIAVRIVPAIYTGEDGYIFHEEWEWLLLLCFYPALTKGSSGQLLDDFDPSSGQLVYMNRPQSYVFGGLVTLNVEEALLTAEVNGELRRLTYLEATEAIRKLINLAPQDSDANDEVTRG